jgi:hypothetical protein
VSLCTSHREETTGNHAPSPHPSLRSKDGTGMLRSNVSMAENDGVEYADARETDLDGHGGSVTTTPQTLARQSQFTSATSPQYQLQAPGCTYSIDCMVNVASVAESFRIPDTYAAQRPAKRDTQSHNREVCARTCVSEQICTRSRQFGRASFYFLCCSGPNRKCCTRNCLGNGRQQLIVSVVTTCGL